MIIGENIKTIRKEKGLTQKRLGELCGIAESNIRKYENGKQNPKLQTLAKIAAALDVKVNDLLESPLYDSPIYNAFKTSGSLNDNLARDFINMKLTEGIDWKPIDIEMVKIFKKLNEIGQAKAIERVEELAEIPCYTQTEKNLPDKED